MTFPTLPVVFRLLLLVGAGLSIGGMSLLMTQRLDGRLNRRAAGATVLGVSLAVLATALEFANVCWTMSVGSLADACTLVSPILFSGQGTGLVVWARLGTVVMLAGFGLPPGTRLARLWWLASSILLAATVAIDGHAGDEGWVSATVLLDTLHVWTALSWLGGLGLLWSRLHPFDEGARSILKRFSLVATVCFPIAILSGLGNALVLVPDWSHLLASSFGWLLLIKTVAVFSVLGLAGYIRQFALPRWVTLGAADGAARRLLLFEFVVGFLILGLSSALSQESP